MLSPSRSLRTKLTLWFLLVFAAIQGTLTTGAFLLRRHEAGALFDERLLGCERAVVQRLSSHEPRWIWTEEYLRQAVPLDVALAFLVIRDREGQVVASTGDVDPRYLPPVVPALQASPPALGRLDVPSAARLLRRDEPVRLVTSAFKDRGGNLYHLQAGAWRNASRGTLAAELDLFLVAGPIGLLAAGVAAWFLAGRALAPMRRLSEAVRSVSPERIEDRVRVESREEEIARIERDLNEALARLEGGFRAQERFIGNVAHDLKTPIAVMLTQSQVLSPRSSTKQDYEDFRLSVEEEMRRLRNLVESFLTLTRADRGQAMARREAVRVPDIVIESIEHCDAEARQCDVRIVPNITLAEDGDAEPVLTGDPELLCTMLDNLIRNAIHFSPARGVVLVEAVCGRDEAVLTIRDRGPGIPPELLGLIFDRFVQAPQEPLQRRGTGLGLAIARSIAELHGGSISARNLEDGGCAFVVLLPLERAGPPFHERADGLHEGPLMSPICPQEAPAEREPEPPSTRT